jgi:hypothetical protein
MPQNQGSIVLNVTTGKIYKMGIQFLVTSSIISIAFFTPRDYLHFGHRTYHNSFNTFQTPIVFQVHHHQCDTSIRLQIFDKQNLSEQSIVDGDPNKLYKIDKFPPTACFSLLSLFLQRSNSMLVFSPNRPSRSVSMA